MSIDDNNFTKAELAAMRAQPASAEVCAEQHARRFYRKDHFVDQVTAERAYFRVLAESLARGQQIADLSRKLGKARRRANDLRRSNEDLRRELFEAATPKLFHASVVTDKPDHPVSAVCVLEGCQELAHEAATPQSYSPKPRLRDVDGIRENEAATPAAEQPRRWRCPDCGIPNLWDALECVRCRLISPPDKERWEFKPFVRSDRERLTTASLVQAEAATPAYSREEFERDRFGQTGDDIRQAAAEAAPVERPDPIEWHACSCGAEHDTDVCPFGYPALPPSTERTR